MKYRPEIDGLRAVAVLPVVLFHAGFGAVGGGFVGVDVFFVISGYLITSIILSDIEAGRFSLAHFYERRARRILPALFLVLFACVPLAWLVLLPRDLSEFAASVLTVLGFSSNFLFWQHSGYFDTTSELIPLLHTWSLAVEEQYYLLFPVFLHLSLRYGRTRVLSVLGAAFVLSLALAQHYASKNPALAFYLLPFRVWELLLGAIVAFHFSRPGFQGFGRVVAETGGLLGISLVILAVILFDKDVPFPGLYALVPALGAAFVILFVNPNTCVGWLLRSKAFVGLGLISYSTYLWHQPVLVFARHLAGGDLDARLALPLCAAVVGMAYLSWRFVELPFRNPAVVSKGRLVGFSVVSALLLAAFGLLGIDEERASLVRFGAERVAQFQAVSTGLQSEFKCIRDSSVVNARPCMLGDAGSSRKLVAIGDSHLGQWAEVLDSIGKQEGLSVLMFSKMACPTVDAPDFYNGRRRVYAECLSWKDNVRMEVRILRPQYVLMTNFSAGYVSGGQRSLHLATWKEGISAYISGISFVDSKMLWLLDNPSVSTFDPLACLQRDLLFGQQLHEGCIVERKSAVNADIMAAEVDVVGRFPGAQVIDFTDFYCDESSCRTTAQGRPLMLDSNHLTVFATWQLRDRLAAYFRH